MIRVIDTFSIEPAARIFIVLALAATLLGCATQHASTPALDTTESGPVMPALPHRTESDRPAPVFGPKDGFAGSPVEGIGRAGMFAVHNPDSTEIAILENGDVSFAARIGLIRQATKSIRIQALVFTGDEAGLYIADILKRKKAAGVDVRLIVDASANLDLQTQWMYFDLKQHGIEVQGYESLYLQWLNEVPLPFLSPARDPEAPNSRYHEKLWIVDGETQGRVAVVGGLNVANQYFRANPAQPAANWRDQDVIVRGSIVADMVTAFERNFDHFVAIKESRGIFNTDHYWKATRHFLEKAGLMDIPYSIRPAFADYVKALGERQPELDYAHARSRFFHSRPRLGESYIWQAYLKLIDAAEQEVLICNAYLIPSAELVDAIGRAIGRGVRVTILTNSIETNDLPELTMVGRSYYEKILSLNDKPLALESGGRVQLWEWYGHRFDKPEQTEGTLHAKYAVFDRRYALVGSYNLDPRSEKLNSETAVVFDNPQLSTALATAFYENDLAHSRRVSVEQAREFQDPTDAIYRLRKTFGTLFESWL